MFMFQFHHLLSHLDETVGDALESGFHDQLPFLLCPFLPDMVVR